MHEDHLLGHELYHHHHGHTDDDGSHLSRLDREMVVTITIRTRIMKSVSFKIDMVKRELSEANIAFCSNNGRAKKIACCSNDEWNKKVHFKYMCSDFLLRLGEHHNCSTWMWTVL